MIARSLILIIGIILSAFSAYLDMHSYTINFKSSILHTPVKQCRICSALFSDTCKYADDSGTVTIFLPESSVINVFAPGHEDTIITLRVGMAAADTIVLNEKKEEYQLPHMVVTASYGSPEPKPSTASSTDFSGNDIKTCAGAAEDIGRYIGTLPSAVASIGEGYDNTFYVRGGHPSEVTFLVDGIEMENINHFSKANGSGGPIGFINADYLDNVRFYAGNMPVSAPSRLSSIVDITMKNGSFSQMKRSAGCKLTGGLLSIEGPIAPGKSSFTLAGRYVDFMPLRSFIKNAGIPRRGDAYGKLVFFSGEDFDVSATGLFSYNTYRYEYPLVQSSDHGIVFDNAMNQNQHIFQGGAGVALHFKSGMASHEAHASVVFRNGTDDDSLSSFTGPFFTSQYAANPVTRDKDDRRHLFFTTNSKIPLGERSALSVGIRLNRNDYALYKSDQSQNEGQYIYCNNGFPDTIVWQLAPIERFLDLHTMESGAHVNFQGAFGIMRSDAGLRADYFPIQSGFTLSPRLSASLLFERAGTVTGSIGLYHQFPSEMPFNIFDYLSSRADLSNDSLAVMGNSFVKQLRPLRCWQACGGYEQRFFETLETKVEAYYKWYDREYNYLAPTLQDVFAVDAKGITALQEQKGRRKASGVELTVGNGQGGRLFYCLSGSLFDVQNRYDDGVWHNDWTDVRYTFSLSGGVRFFNHHVFSASLRGSGGRPFCAQTISADCRGVKSVHIDTSESYFSRRLDPLVTANLRYGFTGKMLGAEVETFVEILNAFNYMPALEYKFNGDHFIAVKPFGFTPIVGCTVRM